MNPEIFDSEEQEADISGVVLIDESLEAEFLQEFEEVWASFFYIFGTHCLTFLNLKNHVSKTFIFILGWWIKRCGYMQEDLSFYVSWMLYECYIQPNKHQYINYVTLAYLFK